MNSLAEKPLGNDDDAMRNESLPGGANGSTPGAACSEPDRRKKCGWGKAFTRDAQHWLGKRFWHLVGDSEKSAGGGIALASVGKKTDDRNGIGDKMDPAMNETTLGTSPPQKPMSFAFAPGSQPLPPYTIRRGVGVGGFGEVYFALSEAGKEVALKRIQRNLDVELRGVSQCLNLKHPNLISLYDICRDPAGGSWVVMEYVSGANLRDVLDRNPDGLSETEVRRWFAGIAAGVNHLHGAGLVHRDLKPGNVFDDLGIVKVGDYGLSKFISTSARGGHTESVGTFHYMAPEIGRGKYGREIDIYALGIILFELLTGKVPFDGESCHEIIVKHLTALPDLSEVPSPYRETIARALDKDPAKRPSSVAELIQPLKLNESDAVAIPVLSASESKDVGRGRSEVLTSLRADSGERKSGLHQPVAKIEGASPQATDAAPVYGVPVASPSDEPLLRAVKTTFAEFSLWWKSLERSPKSRFWIGALIAFVLFINTHWLLPALSILASVYVPYYIIRQMVLHSSEQPSYARAHRIASQAGAPKRPKTRREWQSEIRHSLRAKHNLVRLAELNTSWIASTLTVLALAVAAGVIGLRSGEVTPIALAPYFLLAGVVWVGSQGVLVLGKLWERDEGEGLPRRLVLAGVGAAVGLAAYALNEFLMLSKEPAPGLWSSSELPQALYDPDGGIRAAGMMAHFAILLGAIRWWKSVDPLRRTRLSLWNVAVICVAAWGIHQLVPVPQPTGLLIAGGLAIATQMSAPWINPRQLKPIGATKKQRQEATA